MTPLLAREVSPLPLNSPPPPQRALLRRVRIKTGRDDNAMAAAVAGQGQPRFKEEEYDGLFVYRSGLCAGFRPVGAGHRPHLLRHRSPQ